MAYLTSRYIYRNLRPEDLPLLHPQVKPSALSCCMSVLDRKTLSVVGAVCREVLADDNHRAYAQRLSTIAATPAESSLFLRDTMRSLSRTVASLPWHLPEGILHPQDIHPNTIVLERTALDMFHATFPATEGCGNFLTLPTGGGCTFYFSADALCCGLLLTAGVAPYGVPSGPTMASALTLRMSLFCDSEDDVAAFISDALNMYFSFQGADKKALKAQHTAHQNAFLQQINLHLKPLGFHKRGTCWNLTVNADTSLTFEAQKHRFSDQFFFDLYVNSNAPGIRLEQDIDWQLLSMDDIDDLMHLYITEDILPMIKRNQQITP